MARPPRWLGVQLIAAAALLIASASPARAVDFCGEAHQNSCGSSNPWPCCGNGGNCKWWAFEAACRYWKIALPYSWLVSGTMASWVQAAKSDPQFEVSSTPVVNSIACMSSPYEHAGWVTAVNGSSITVTEQACNGPWSGTRTADHPIGEFNLGYIAKKGGTSCACNSGQVDSHACGKCGKQSRNCAGCDWGLWGSCTGEGECTSGDVQHQTCGTCARQRRVCTASCQWGAWGNCTQIGQEADNSCDTGLKGECKKGKVSCTDNQIVCTQIGQPSDEVCDQLDNDCDGEVDEQCTGSGDGHIPSRPTDSLGVCQCRAGGGAALVLPGLVFFGLLVLARARRRR